MMLCDELENSSINFTQLCLQKFCRIGHLFSCCVLWTGYDIIRKLAVQYFKYTQKIEVGIKQTIILVGNLCDKFSSFFIGFMYHRE